MNRPDTISFTARPDKCPKCAIGSFESVSYQRRAYADQARDRAQLRYMRSIGSPIVDDDTLADLQRDADEPPSEWLKWTCSACGYVIYTDTHEEVERRETEGDRPTNPILEIL